MSSRTREHWAPFTGVRRRCRRLVPALACTQGGTRRAYLHHCSEGADLCTQLVRDRRLRKTNAEVIKAVQGSGMRRHQEGSSQDRKGHHPSSQHHLKALVQWRPSVPVDLPAGVF